jgi:DNA modification methylase
MATKVEIGNATLYLGDCADILPTLGHFDAVVTDPPYPNNANHFIDGIETAKKIIKNYYCDHWLIFWDEIERPESNLPLVGVHIWHRTNSNRPDNYEPIYEFNKNGKKVASRVYPFGVIYEGLTGVIAHGHPTEKNIKLMEKLIPKKSNKILDPFMGSGTTGVACMNLQKTFVGIEKEQKYFDIACKRIEDAQRQVTLF